MEKLQVSTNPEVEAIFKNYPDHVRHKLEALRKLIIEVAQENNDINYLGETLK